MDIANIVSFEINASCYESFPCFHDVNVTYKDGRTKKMQLNGISLRRLVVKFGYHDPWMINHLKEYEDENES